MKYIVFIKLVYIKFLMNKHNFVLSISILASISISLGAFGTVLAQDNMTSELGNFTGNQTFTPIDEIPSKNTSEITDAQRGIDANKIIGQ